MIKKLINQPYAPKVGASGEEMQLREMCFFVVTQAKLAGIR
jgi:hypothetical protein